LRKRPTRQKNEERTHNERLPSSLAARRQVATPDTKLAEMGGDLVSNPLERKLGSCDFEGHTAGPGDAAHAFKKLNDLWDEEIQENDSDQEISNESKTDSDTTNETTANTREVENTNIKNENAKMRITGNTNEDRTTQRHMDGSSENKTNKRTKRTHQHPRREPNAWNQTTPWIG
jgi:hypothetical protein